MTDLAEPRSTRPALSPAARALHLERIFARLQEGGSSAAATISADSPRIAKSRVRLLQPFEKAKNGNGRAL